MCYRICFACYRNHSIYSYPGFVYFNLLPSFTTTCKIYTLTQSLLWRYHNIIFIKMNWKFGLGSSRHSNCNNALYTGTKRAVKIIFHLGRSLISSLSFYTKFLCFTSSLTQTHSFFSNCKETKQLILMQSKVRVKFWRQTNMPIAAYFSPLFWWWWLW